MSETFDPYRKWLGIPPAEQPPDHYRLLGLGRFEDDPDTISNAADRQMTHLRTFQTGPHSEVSQRLLNEIAAARVCLLNPAKKSDYDNRLRNLAAPRALPAPAPVAPLAPLAPLVPISHGELSLLQAPIDAARSLPAIVPRRRAKKKLPFVRFAIASAVLLAIAAGAALILGRGQQSLERERDAVQPLAQRGATDPKHDNDGAIASPSSGGAGAASKLAPPARQPEQPAAKLEIVAAQWGKDDHWQDVAEHVRSLIHDERLIATAWGSFFLGIPDPAFGEVKRLRISYRAAGGEERTAEFADGEFIFLDGHPVGTGKAATAGLELLEARYGAGSTWVDVLPRLNRWVHGDRLAVRVERMLAADPAPGGRKALFVRYRTAEGQFAAHAWDGQEFVLDARPAPRAGKATDLIAAADPERHSTGAAWRKEAGALVAPAGAVGNLAIPAAVASDYLLRIEFAAEPLANDVGITLPVGERQVQLVIDGWGSAISGLQLVDGTAGPDNPTARRATFFERGQPSVVCCAVRDSSIYATCNGRVVVDWRGDPARLSALAETQAPEAPAIVLRGLATPWRVTRLEVSPLEPEPAPTVVKSGEVVDLLKQIDIQLDAVTGAWQLSDEGLLSPGGDASRLGVPVMPPDDYELRLVVERKSGDNALFVGLIVEGRQTVALLDGWSGQVQGLHGLDGKEADQNESTTRGRLFVDDRPRELICIVHPGSVHIACEDRTLIDWRGDARRFWLSCDVPDALGLFLGDWYTQFLVSKFELLPLPPQASDNDDPSQTATAPTRAQRSLADLVGAPATEDRLGVPNEQELAAANEQVEKEYGAEWKGAKTAPDRLAAARKLYDAGGQAANNPALRYALWREAGRRAIELGDVPLACDALDKIGAEFRVDLLAEKLAAVSQALTKARSAEQSWTLALQALLLSDRALAAQRFEEARKFAALAAAAGRRTRNHDLAKSAEQRQAAVRRRQDVQERIAQLMEKLREQPDDAAANRTVSLDLCLLQGDWRRGLPLLARSGEPRLAEIARLEAEADQDQAKRAALVDAWLAEADAQAGELRQECRLQAKYWFERGLPAEVLADPARKAAFAKLTALPGISPARVAPGLDLAMFDGGDFQQFRARRVDAKICHQFGFGSPHPAVPGDYFSLRWTGWIKPPLPGKYVIRTNSDDSIRVRINNQLIIDHWDRGAGDEQAEVELTDQLQPFSVEYNDYTANAEVCLRWSLLGLSDLQVVPAEAFYHDPKSEP